MPSEVAKRLRDRRLNVWEEAKGIAEKAAEENRALTEEEQGRWDAYQEEMGKLDTRIRAVLDTEKRAKEADDAFDALSGKRPDQGAAAQRAGGGKMLEEIRKWARGDDGAGRVMEVRRAPELGPINYRVLTTGGVGGTNASSIIPIDFYDMLIAHLIEVSGVMQCGPTVLNTGGGETLQVPKTTAHSTAASAAQAGGLPTSDPAFATQPLSAFKYGVLLQVARELIDDTAVDLLGYLAMQAGRALGNAFGTDLVNGTGTGQPNGIINTATVGVTGSVTGVSGAPSYANLVDLEYSVIAPYRQSRSCYWLAADKTIGGFRKITDTVGRPIWEPSAVLGSPDLLLGKPLVADPFMPAMATAAKPIAFGDFSQFFVRLVGGVRFERSDDFAFGSDLVTFRAILRGDGTLVDRTGAIRLYQGAAS
jgi:HK97 family phage major capsid protein